MSGGDARLRRMFSVADVLSVIFGYAFFFLLLVVILGSLTASLAESGPARAARAVLVPIFSLAVVLALTRSGRLKIEPPDRRI